MEQGFWQSRWSQQRIGFHQAEGSELLRRYAPDWLGDAAARAGQRVLVPLCGKSQDLHWLASQGLQVVGVEFVTQAVEAFFAEAGMTADVTLHAEGTRYHTPAIDVWRADMFALGEAQLGRFPLIYDRAALVALPPARRAEYVRHLLSLCEPGARILLVTFTHTGAPDGSNPGPPFCVPDDEVREIYAAASSIEQIHADDLTGVPAALTSAGISQVTECVWR
ncbi:MAG: hypothetical protein AB7K09_14575, partial [Planctomycetota bacterium]